jgi:hypothetical protein
MTRAGILAAQTRAWEKMRSISMPGTYQSREPGAPDEALEAAVLCGSTTVEAVAGGLVRVRTATVFISKCCHPAEPVVKDRVTITAKGSEPADYRVEDFHDQASGHWVIRCVQWVK